MHLHRSAPQLICWVQAYGVVCALVYEFTNCQLVVQSEWPLFYYFVPITLYAGTQQYIC